MSKLAIAFCLAAFAAAGVLDIAPAVAQEAVVKQLPTPDLSRVSPATAESLRSDRAEFEKAKVGLETDRLAEAYALIGGSYSRAGLYDTAGIAFANAAALSPYDGRWTYLQGINALAQKRRSEAVAFFDRAYKLNQFYLPIRVSLATMKIEDGDLEGARKLLEEYVAKTKTEPMPYAMLGEIALKQKRYAPAVEALREALRIDPQATRLNGELAQAYEGVGDANAAAEARSKAGTAPPRLGDPLALGAFASTAPKATEDPFAKEMADASFFLQAQEYAVARQHLDAALTLKPNSPVALALYSRAETAAGNLPQAKSRAEAAVAVAPTNALAQLSLGLAREVAGDDVGARDAYEKALTADPSVDEARLRLANTLMRMHQYVAAADQYRKLAVQPDKSDAYARVVAAQVAAGRCAPALKDVNDALSKKSGDPFLLQLFVRLASTCAAANVEEKRMALDYGAKLYAASEANGQVGEAYALALAANGKWDDAVQTQGGAIFDAVRINNQPAVARYRQVFQQLQAKKLPDRPWTADHPLFNPPRLTPDPKPDAAPPAGDKH